MDDRKPYTTTNGLKTDLMGQFEREAYLRSLLRGGDHRGRMGLDVRWSRLVNITIGEIDPKDRGV